MTIAKETDLPDLLAHLGYSVRRVGRYYTTREMDSLRILDRHRWYRYSERQGGDAITLLQRFCGMRFPEAVEYLLAYHGRARDSPAPKKIAPKEEKVPFALPPAHTDQRRVFAYLSKRGIAPQVTKRFIQDGLLYEDHPYHNCVFVGRDGSGKPVFANKRGTYDQGGSSFKRDVAGSDKSVAFRLNCDSALDWVTVFEAPIDLMSFCTLQPEVSSNAVALCGLSERALDTYLRENPHLRHIVLCLDADGPGQKAAAELKEKYTAAGYTVSAIVPAKGKDWNQYLQQIMNSPEKLAKGGHFLVADLGKIISEKAAADTQWREQKQAERKNTTAMQDASIDEILSDPEAYARYLTMQGDNPTYSAGNIALAMAQDPQATVIGTRERWKALGRSVLETERDKGAKIFAKAASGRGYILADAYDIRQTQGREIQRPQLQNDSKEMESALVTLLHHTPVPVGIDNELPVPAWYDPQKMELSINPAFSDSEAFAAIAAEIAQAKFHDRGFNRYYSRKDRELEAQSVSYVLCRRFGVQRELPNLSRLHELCGDSSLQERRKMLETIQSVSKQIGNSIERSVAPQQRAGPSVRRAER